MCLRSQGQSVKEWNYTCENVPYLVWKCLTYGTAQMMNSLPLWMWAEKKVKSNLDIKGGYAHFNMHIFHS